MAANVAESARSSALLGEIRLRSCVVAANTLRVGWPAIFSATDAGAPARFRFRDGRAAGRGIGLAADPDKPSARLARPRRSPDATRVSGGKGVMRGRRTSSP